MPENQRSFVGSAAILVIQLYRNTLSHMILHSCRFFPTCSEYAIQAIQRYGASQGLWRASHRLLRCHPLSPPGLDPLR